MRPALFLDRDGTLVDDPGFLADPALVRLFPGAGSAVGRVNDAGFLAVIVTNQGGIGRGLFSEAQYRAVERQVTQLVEEAGGRIDATYFCPHYPATDGPCDCRKPGTLLYRRAAEDLGIDFGSSWWVGDRMSDLEPASTLGGRGILVLTGHGPEHEAAARAAGFAVVDDVGSAARLILGNAPGLAPG